MIGTAKEQLGLLIELQKKDLILDGFRAQLKQIPKTIEDKRTELENLRQQLATMKDQASKTQVQRKEKELELEQVEAQIKKNQQELNQVKTNEAFKALLEQIGNAKTAKGKLEEEVLLLMDAQDQIVKEQKKEEQAFKQTELQWNAEIQSLEEEKNKAEAQLAAGESEREHSAQEIPEDALTRYHRIRAAGRGTAIVPIKNDACGGCKLSLPPHIVNEVKKAQELVLCESCQRILTL